MKEKAIQELNETLQDMANKDDAYKLGSLARLAASLCGLCGLDTYKVSKLIDENILFNIKAEYKE